MKEKKKQVAKIYTQNKAIPKTTPPTVQNEKQETVIDDSSPKLKKAFFGSIIFMLLFIWITGFNVGYHCDEMDMNSYAKANMAWYASGGKDTTFLNAAVANVPTVYGIRVDTLVRYYGSAFDYLAVGFNKITGIEGGKNEFNSRHVFNELFAILAILFAGLVAVRASGWRAALFTAWLMFLTPTFFGLAMVDTKDIPFCTGYIASIYFIILFLEELPAPSWRTCIFLMLSFAFTVGMRVGGLLVFFYFGMFGLMYMYTKKGLKEQIQKNLGQLSLKTCVIILGALTIVILSWPFVLRHPIKNFLGAINVVSKFPLKVTMIFEGEFISSKELPKYYLPKFMYFTIPVFIILSFCLSLFYLRKKSVNQRIAFIALFTSAFPVIYAIMTNAPTYNLWRHFTFVYPGMLILTGIGLHEFMKMFTKPAYQYGFVAICCLGMLRPVLWSIKNHPIEYAYYNEFSGGFKNVCFNYETDYWTISLKEGIDWLFKNEPIEQSKDTITMITNAPLFSDYYIKMHFPKAKVKIIDGGFKGRCTREWTYAVYGTIYLQEAIIESEFPPYGLIHSVDVDEMPQTIVIKDTSRLELQGINAFYQFRFPYADSLFQTYMRNGGKNNTGIFGYVAACDAMRGDVGTAIELGNKAIQYLPSMFPGYLGVGIAYLRKNNINQAMPYLEQVYMMTNKDEMIKQLFRQIYPPLVDMLESRIRSGK